MNDGGSAFPFVSESVGSPGMSLRDWFAGMAMQGLVKLLIAPLKQNASVGVADTPNNRKLINHELARRAYEVADAMLAERAKNET